MELGTLYLQDKHNPAQAMPYLKQAVELRPQKSWNWLLYASSLYGIHNCQAVDAFQHYGAVEYFTPMAHTGPRGDSHHQLEGMFKKVRPARPQPF